LPRLLLLAVCLALAVPGARAQDPPGHAAPSCTAPFKVGYRIIRVGKLTAALWYPTAARERTEAYADGTRGDIARGAPPLVSCGGFPLVVFSHGLGGCGIQSVFFTEALARQGYVVVAPDHADASFCSTDGRRPAAPQTMPPPLLDPGSWNAGSYLDRRDDVRTVLDAMLRDAAFRDAIAPDRIGIAGHSLGGYVGLAMTGAWKDWHDPRLRAALLLSPYSLPLSLRGELRAVRVPVMYQGAELDVFVTPFIEGPQGAYAAAHAPKYFAKLRGGHHFAWTNLQCIGAATAAACARERPEARLINAYGIAFFEQHLKGRAQTLLRAAAPNLSAYVHDP
jgi:predicted dienelactone hydrolase